MRERIYGQEATRVEQLQRRIRRNPYFMTETFYLALIKKSCARKHNLKGKKGLEKAIKELKNFKKHILKNLPHQILTLFIELQREVS